MNRKLEKNKQKAGRNDNEIVPVSSGLNDTHVYLYDFHQGYNGAPVFFSGDSSDSTPEDGEVESTNQRMKAKTIQQKIRMKPIDALKELEVIPTPWSLVALDEKIDMLNTKKDLIKQHYTLREIEGLLERLENRKKYNLHKTFFERFQNTNDAKIKQLLDTYDLVMKTSDIFIPEFPDEAIKVMREYTDVCAEICEKKPIFYVIAEEKDFQKNWDRRDPILLVQSPFGFYWQILGAWDKEMLLLSEL